MRSLSEGDLYLEDAKRADCRKEMTSCMYCIRTEIAFPEIYHELICTMRRVVSARPGRHFDMDQREVIEEGSENRRVSTAVQVFKDSNITMLDEPSSG
jgi:hypothetical protein